MKFSCPLCGGSIEGEESWVGLQADCPHCAKNITIPAGEGGIGASQGSAMPVAPKPKPPRSQTPPKPPLVSALLSDFSEATPPSRSPRQRGGTKSKKGRNWIETAVCGVAVAAVAALLIYVLAVFARSKSHADESPSQQVSNTNQVEPPVVSAEKAPASRNTTNKTSPPATSIPKDNPTDPKKDIDEKPPAGALAIKGIWLGMNGEKAVREIISRGNGRISSKPTDIVHNNDKRQGFDLFYQDEKGQTSGHREGAIFTDAQTGEVNMFYFDGKLTTFLFNITDTPVEEFVQEFINSYHVPNIKPSELQGRRGWKYISEDGWTLFITTDKLINIQLSQKRKFD